MADDIGMRPTSAASTINRLSAAGKTMADGWKLAGDDVASLAGQLGKGELGAAFLAGYQDPAAEAVRVVEQCCGLPAQFADSGNQCVTQYIAADQHGQQTINSIG